MTLNNVAPGGNYVPEFQVAPAPWVTQSSVPSSGIVGYSFDTVCSHVRILNHDSAAFNVGFSQNGVNGNNKILVPTSGTLDLDCRFTSLFIRGTSGQQFSLFVGQTGIPIRNHPIVTGSNGFGVG